MRFKVTTVILSVLVLSVWLISCVDVPTNGPDVPDFRSSFRFFSAAEDLGSVDVSVDGQSIGSLSFMGEIAHQDFPSGSRVVTLGSEELRVPMTFDEKATIVVFPLLTADPERRFQKVTERRTFESAQTESARILRDYILISEK